MHTKAETHAKLETVKYLRRILRRGATVYTANQSVARSNCSAIISVHVVRAGELLNITRSVGEVLGYPLQFGSVDGLKVSGGGMDRGYHIVHSLSYALHGMKHHDAAGFNRSGYTLRHRWI